MKIGTFCTGIDSAGVAMKPLGVEVCYAAEIEPFPAAVLAYRHGMSRPRRMPDPDEAGLAPKRAAERRAAIKALERIVYWGNATINYGDMTQIDPAELPFVDLLVAGTPCQGFSIAGLRGSLSDARGQLTLYFVKVVHELVRLGLIRSILWENVPDVLNTDDNAFGAFLGGLVGHDTPLVCPYPRGRWPNAGVADGPLGTAAWRVEDGQFSEVAQRRERVFLVASFGNGPDPIEVLFERQGLSRDPPARGQAGEGIARPLASGSKRGSGYRNDADTAEKLIPERLAFGGNNTAGPIDLATARTASHTASGRQDFETETFVVEPVIPVAYSIMPQNSGKDYKAREVDVAQPLMAAGPVGGNQGGDYVVQPVAFNSREETVITGDVTGALGASSPQSQAIAFSLRGREGGARAEVEDDDLAPALRAAEGGSTRPFVACATGEITHTLTAEGFDASEDGTGPGPPLAADGMAVRRITCVEAERLMGFEDNYTLIPWPTANRKGRDLEETIAYLIGHGYSPEDAALFAQTPDGPRYKALGNSKITKHVRKIGAGYKAALERYLAAHEAAA